MNCIPRKGPRPDVMRLQRWLPILLLLLPLTVPAQQSEPSPPPAESRDVLVIDELICRGNVATSCDFILGHIYLSSGDSVDEDELGNARLRLSSLPSFESINIYLERGTARGHVRVVVEVVEADPHVREWLAGTSLRSGDVRQLLAGGRLTHQNLFGTGKLLDAMLYASVPIDGFDRRSYLGRVQYVDPHWRDDKRMFLVAGLSGYHSASDFAGGGGFESTSFSTDVAIGRRLFDFSFLSLRYSYSVQGDLKAIGSDGRELPSVDSTDAHLISATYGWNSEDDPYFPTRGSRASAVASWAPDARDVMTGGGIRKTWTTDNGTSWVVQLEDTPVTEYRGTLVSENFQYFGGFARPIGAGDEIQRGRWYVEVGASPSVSRLGRREREYGLRVGVRLKTRTFGFADLYVIGFVVDSDWSTW